MSRPQHIKEILPGVMQNIKARMERQRRKGVVSAVGGFMSGKPNLNKRPSRQKARQSKLW